MGRGGRKGKVLEGEWGKSELGGREEKIVRWVERKGFGGREFFLKLCLVKR